MQVVEQQHQRPRARRVLEERREAVEQEKASLRRFHRGGHDAAGEPVPELRDVRGSATHLRAERARVGVLRVGADDPDPGPVSRRALAFVATTDEHPDADASRMVGQLLGGACLAYPGLTRQQDDTSAARDALVQRDPELPHLLTAANERAARRNLRSRPLLPRHCQARITRSGVRGRGVTCVSPARQRPSPRSGSLPRGSRAAPWRRSSERDTTSYCWYTSFTLIA